MFRLAAIVGLFVAATGVALAQTSPVENTEVLLITTQQGEIVGEIHANGDVILAKDAPVEPRLVDGPIPPSVQVQLGIPGALKLILGRYR